MGNDSADQVRVAPASSTHDQESGGDEARVALVRKLFEDHNHTLVSFLAARLNSRAEARDVAQEAYVRMLQLEGIGAVGFLRAYLFRIASNIAVDRMRRRVVREAGPPQALFEELLSRPEPERLVLAEQELDVIKAAIAELPEKCRRAFALYMFGERTIAQIAESMGLTERMIRNYVAQALAHCRYRRDQANAESNAAPSASAANRKASTPRASRSKEEGSRHE